MTLKELKNVHVGDTSEEYEKYSVLDFTDQRKALLMAFNLRIYRIPPMTTKRAILLGYTQYKPGIFYKP